MKCLGPNLAGSWYPADAQSLGDDVRTRLDPGKAPSPRRNEVTAIIAPHAGLRFSGATAGHGFRRILGRRAERVVLLGPSHYVGFRGAAVPRAGEYRTPLGPVQIDTDSTRELAGRADVCADDSPFRPEHSLEMELPFLQTALVDGWRLVPVLLGAGSTAASDEKVARALEPLWNDSSLFVVSSDFTHYGKRFGFVPFEDDVPARIEALDRQAFEKIERLDLDGFERFAENDGKTICGRHAIGVLLRLAGRNVAADLTGYDTSGHITSDWDASVSYASMVFASAPS